MFEKSCEAEKIGEGEDRSKSVIFNGDKSRKELRMYVAGVLKGNGFRDYTLIDTRDSLGVRIRTSNVEGLGKIILAGVLGGFGFNLEGNVQEEDINCTGVVKYNGTFPGVGGDIFVECVYNGGNK